MAMGTKYSGKGGYKTSKYGSMGGKYKSNAGSCMETNTSVMREAPRTRQERGNGGPQGKY